MYKSLTQKNVNRLIGLMVIMILLLSSVALFNKPVSASSGVNSSCGPWFDDGLCCETWWPGVQTHQLRQCSDTSTGTTIIYYEARCKTPSICPYQ